LTTRLKRAADTVFLEAKNSTIPSISNVPAWFYVLLLVLGWNELMAVLRNPVLFVLFVLMSGGGYLVVQAGLLGPLMKVGNAVVDQSVDIARVLSLLKKGV
jgi:protein SEY1